MAEVVPWLLVIQWLDTRATLARQRFTRETPPPFLHFIAFFSLNVITFWVADNFLKKRSGGEAVAEDNAVEMLVARPAGNAVDSESGTPPLIFFSGGDLAGIMDNGSRLRSTT